MPGKDGEVQVLLIEDNAEDACLIREVLQDQNSSCAFLITHVEYLQAGLERLQNDSPDVVLLDLSLPDSQGLVTLTRVLSNASRIPVIILTGLNDEAMALESLRLGAQDFLVKSRMAGDLLSRMIRYGIERKRTEEKLRKNAEDLAASNRQLTDFSEALQRANRQLKCLDEAKSKFIAIASHELKTPLAAVIGYLSLVLSGRMGALNEEILAALKHVKTASDRLLRLVDDLLDISKIEMGQLKMDKAPFDLGGFLKEEMQVFQAQAKEYEISLEIKIGGDLKRVVCDKDRIRQVFDNLISNAVKYTPRKGIIQIEAKNIESGVQIDFKDTGIGVRKEDEARVFEPFQHIQKAGLHGEKSSGVGLAVVKKIIEAHGGKICLTSVEGQGTMFSVTLPVAEDESAGASV